MKKVGIVLLILIFLATNVLANPYPEEEDDDFDVFTIVALASFIGMVGVVIYAMHINNKKARTEQMEGEEVRINIEENGYVDIKGKYWITNDSRDESSMKINYPYAEADYLHSPECIEIKTDYDGSTVIHEYRKKGNGWVFDTSLKPEGTNVIAVHYNQKTEKNSFKYLLTTARQWGSPIESAEFTIKIPEKYELTKSTYNYEYVGRHSNKNVYKISETGLFPSKELEFSWKEKQN
ncbi:MAG: hypothetical protein JSU92_02580 [Deltaproteobacteria bacterium]|nr:MAG: hypothetical protein JSU92_02580 [Deltaproteobacteria bacterium]